MINGILVINKSKGMTSGDVVYKLRKILKTRKIGHAGTLDPEVEGVLPIAIGQATKLIELMHERPKSYTGRGLLGFSTDSYDTEGKVLQRKAVSEKIPLEEIQKGMNSFLGKIDQVPPIYSAVKVNGKRLYEYAREGIQVTRPVRSVEIFKYKLLEPVNYQNEQEEFGFNIECSKGTYVRSLVNDLGEKLGYPAVMTYLQRTSSSGFNLEKAVKLEELEANPELVLKYILPIDSFFADYETIDMSEQIWKKVKNGNAISLRNDAKKIALRYNKKVKAIYELKSHTYRPYLMLLQNE
ncbi:tRNA pseudouridine(55) synthase TruB [Lactobacillus mulieris]|mgnify:CR=1 FL=1|jgi:tRNA pseudouridine synthase B|uniref:tRNA pseudouridine synthase B n=2 Tax=Lactobacillus mulieris TaxID=2508708 RepID=A0AAP3M2K2_9LACO|nr:MULTISPECIES: tRNA pseudouridine(55) synthase TruB [Lactobacillus]EEU21504.1 tRNA pseudouridine synthase B [Lactobacillus jensenii 27-2-CHN]EEX24375.1 tRNA pseudouridine synthase B [Lactobacillus jensenii 115-3-CHN]KAA9244954.1 tRNA pseudouridine(55) synthase TruB [Lactobacillus jensenii]KAA9370385.1 tRNA pseudouridine(55) synthase TruB [Lactobacillus jensenii]KAA9372149.1 tRNA pseudouridine(55) synthase TruB [Lactobacillus jensenii]